MTSRGTLVYLCDPMSLLSDAVEFKKFDVRVVERNVQRGVMRAEDVQKNTKDLPDDLSNAEWISIEKIAEQQSSST